MVADGALLDALRRHGRVASAYQTLTPQFKRWADPDSACVVAYADARSLPLGPRTWVAAGEPIGPLADVAGAADRFEAAAREAGAGAFWFGVESPARLGVARTALVIGAQPVWEARSWEERMAQKASLRAQVNRARNKGVAAEEVEREAAASDPALRRILDGWIARRGMPPLAFLADPYSLDHLADRRVFVASQDGQAIAYLILGPIPARDGWHVEWIIRAPDAPNGTSALLLDAAFHAVDPQSLVTLGLVPLSSQAPASPQAPPLAVRALLAWTRAHARRFYNFEGLERFKGKFLPDAWEPIYLVTPRRRVSLATFYAVADAFAGRRSPARLVGRALADAVASEARTAWDALSSRGTRTSPASTG